MHNHASFIDQNGLYTHIRRGPTCRAEWSITWHQRFQVETRDTMPEPLPLFEIRMRKRGRACRWYFCTIEGHVVMQGSEGSRSAAKYQARRALFLMLLASVRTDLSTLDITALSQLLAVWKPSRNKDLTGLCRAFHFN